MLNLKSILAVKPEVVSPASPTVFPVVRTLLVAYTHCHGMSVRGASEPTAPVAKVRTVVILQIEL